VLGDAFTFDLNKVRICVFDLERKREIERERKKEREKERKKEREKERKKERRKIYLHVCCPCVFFDLFCCI
jgi:F0F1-type ATP synthase epsilon subunit